jgi:hypothetical protein
MGGLQAGLGRIRDEHAKRQEEMAGPDQFDEFTKGIRDGLKTPLEKLSEALFDIESHAAENVGAGGLTVDEVLAAKMQAAGHFFPGIEQQKPIDETPSPIRPHYAEMGTAAAFSASFGNSPASKHEQEIARNGQQQTQLLREIKKLLGGEFNIGP